jgi:hypothetical protein
VNDELKRIWKEAVAALFLRYYPSICLEGLRKPRKTSVRIANLRADTWKRDIPNTKQEC